MLAIWETEVYLRDCTERESQALNHKVGFLDETAFTLVSLCVY